MLALSITHTQWLDLSSGELDEESPAPKKGLFALKFMQKAAMKQREQAQNMLKEFEKAARGVDGEDEEDDDDKSDADRAMVGRKQFSAGSGKYSTNALCPMRV